MTYQNTDKPFPFFVIIQLLNILKIFGKCLETSQIYISSNIFWMRSIWKFSRIRSEYILKVSLNKTNKEV